MQSDEQMVASSSGQIRQSSADSFLTDAGEQLLVGMNWFALVGSNPRQEVLQRARATHATHYVVSGSDARVAACKRRINSRHIAGNTSIHRRLFSLAAIFASRHPLGAHVCLLSDSQEGYWLIACSEGYVLCSSDKHFSSKQSALHAVADLKTRFIDLDLTTLEATWCLQRPTWLEGDFPVCSVVNKIPDWYARSSSIKAMLIASATIGACWMWFGSTSGESTRLNGSTNHGGYPPQTGVSLDRLSDRTDEPGSLWASIQKWSTLPVEKDGWALTSLDCESVQMLWQCQAIYRRRSPSARNHHLQHLSVTHATLAFEDLDRAIVGWVDEHHANSVVYSSIDDLKWLDQIREIETGFESVQVGSVRAHASNQSHTLRFKGPLRSAILTNRLLLPIYWTRVSISVDASSETHNSGKGSALQFIAEGVLFVL